MKKASMLLRIVGAGMIMFYLGLVIMFGRILRGTGYIDLSLLTGWTIPQKGSRVDETMIPADEPRTLAGKRTTHRVFQAWDSGRKTSRLSGNINKGMQGVFTKTFQWIEGHSPSMNQLRIDLRTEQVYARAFMNISIGLARCVVENMATRFRSIADYTARYSVGVKENVMRRYSDSQAWQGSDRRRMERGKVDIPCDVRGRHHGADANAAGRIADLSRGGMYVESDAPFDEGTEAQITAIQFGETFWVMGKVLRSKENGMAIEFAENVPRAIENILNAGGKSDG